MLINTWKKIFLQQYHTIDIKLVSQNLMAMSLFLKTCCLGDSTGISFVDSTPIRICEPKRIRNNKMSKGIATNGKSTMRWLHEFKLHIIINDKGEIQNFTITQANVDDRSPLKKEKLFTPI